MWWPEARFNLLSSIYLRLFCHTVAQCRNRVGKKIGKCGVGNFQTGVLDSVSSNVQNTKFYFTETEKKNVPVCS